MAGRFDGAFGLNGMPFPRWRAHRKANHALRFLVKVSDRRNVACVRLLVFRVVVRVLRVLLFLPKKHHIPVELRPCGRVPNFLSHLQERVSEARESHCSMRKAFRRAEWVVWVRVSKPEPQSMRRSLHSALTRTAFPTLLISAKFSSTLRARGLRVTSLSFPTY